MKRPHKFRTNDNPFNVYDRIVFCEYCGLIAFHANRNTNPPVPDGDCPNSPDEEEKEANP